MEEKLSLNISVNSPKRFHRIGSQKRMGVRPTTNLSNRHSGGEAPGIINIRSISTSSATPEIEPVLIYTNPDEHKGLIAKQNKGKSGVYR